jgi:hypothetical protein
MLDLQDNASKEEVTKKTPMLPAPVQPELGFRPESTRPNDKETKASRWRLQEGIYTDIEGAAVAGSNQGRIKFSLKASPHPSKATQT